MPPVIESIVVGFLVLLTPSPKKSLAIAAQATHADYWELRNICSRESTCRSRVRVHKADRWATGHMYRKSVEVGWLSRNCPREGQEVRGILGLSTSYNTRWLGVRCLWPALFDVPIVSAFAGAFKHNAKCWRRVEIAPGKYIREVNPHGANRWCR